MRAPAGPLKVVKQHIEQRYSYVEVVAGEGNHDIRCTLEDVARRHNGGPPVERDIRCPGG